MEDLLFECYVMVYWLLSVERPYRKVISGKAVRVLSVLPVVSRYWWKGKLPIWILLLSTILRKCDVVVLGVLAQVVVKVVAVHHRAHWGHEGMI